MNGATQTDVRLPNVTTLSGLVEQFRSNADAAAIMALQPSGSFITLTYSELAGEISRLAAGLRNLGLSDGAMVMLWAPNCPEWVVAYLAIRWRRAHPREAAPPAPPQPPAPGDGGPPDDDGDPDAEPSPPAPDNGRREEERVPQPAG